MSVDRHSPPLAIVSPAGRLNGDRHSLSQRLGLNVPRDWWPTAPMLKGLEAAGFAWVQVHAPTREVLADRSRAAAHANALRRALEPSGLRLVLHAPDELSAGEPLQDRALDGLIDYASATGAELVVYHGANVPAADGGTGAGRVRDRLAREADALAARARKLDARGITVCVENLAPVWPGLPARVCHAPAAIAAMVDTLASPAFAMTFDAGHANITAELDGAGDVAALLADAGDRVGLVHLHDNLGGRRQSRSRAGVDPLRLDLHLAPGAGTLAWETLGPALRDHHAPLLLEIHPPHRPDPIALATVTEELLGGPARHVRPSAIVTALPGRTAAAPIPPG
jgi:sugar phosphate isomerase/epimerase